MSSLVVTMEIHYHGAFVQTLDPSGSTRSLLCIYGPAADLSTPSCSFGSILGKQF